MTLAELNKQIEDLKNEFDAKIKALTIQYCDANNPYKIGDKFNDHIGSVIIEKINYYIYSDPCCIYTGLEINKDGSINKRQNKRQAYQSNEVKPTK